MISRRVFLTLAASAIASCSKPKLIFATEKDQDVEFTADMAIQMASTFAENVLMDTDLKAYQATPFFDLEQIAKGYMVDYKKHGIPYGYIVFDSTVEGFISSFSCYPNCKSPFLKLTGTEQVTNDNSRPLLYKISPLEYGIATNRNVLQLNTGRNIEIQTNAAMLTSSNPTTWNQVLVPYSVAMSSYTINSAKYIGETYGISESDIEQMTGHYACAVTALMLISGFHGLGSLYEDASNYMKIWNNTSTTALPANEQTKTGVILGSTNKKTVVPAMQNTPQTKDQSCPIILSQMHNTLHSSPTLTQINIHSSMEN